MNIKKMTIKQKIGQMLCFAFHGTSYNAQLKTLIEDYEIGNIVHFARNIISPQQAIQLNQDMQRNSKRPLFISLDQEGGMVRRVVEGITYLPGAMALAATNHEHIYNINKKVASELKSLGFHMNYAPVGDVNNNPLNPVINSRSYSDNPTVVAKCATNAALGMQAGGILPTIKHFPGHGDTNVDSHVGLPHITKSYRQLMRTEVPPFKMAIDSGIDGVMISHILFSAVDPIYPSSLSYQVITELLKNTLGFKGLITTDSLTMQAIWSNYSIEEIIERGVDAGNDILVFCGKADINEQKHIIETFYRLYEERRISIKRINESVEKILKLKEKYCIKYEEPIIPNIELSHQLVDSSITKVKDYNLLPIVPQDRVLIVFPKITLASLNDNDDNTTHTLQTYLGYDQIIIDDSSDEDRILKVQDAYDKIIFATYQVRNDDFQHRIFQKLNHDKVIVVALRSPYDICVLKQTKTYICTYDITKETLAGLAKRLKDNLFKGTLPIRL